MDECETYELVIGHSSKLETTERKIIKILQSASIPEAKLNVQEITYNTPRSANEKENSQNQIYFNNLVIRQRQSSLQDTKDHIIKNLYLWNKNTHDRKSSH